MPDRPRFATRAMWLLAGITVFGALRYFLVPVPWLKPPGAEKFIEGPFVEAAQNVAPSLYENHRALFLTHIAFGIVALITGLPQFLPRLRTARPRFHRTTGGLYMAAVMIASLTGFALSFPIIEPVSVELRPSIYPTVVGFASLAIVWLAVTVVAFRSAKRRRWTSHRAWMIRSFSLTFAAVTVRMVAPVLLLFTRDPVVIVTGSIWSWPLNLIVAEWLVRRNRTPIPGYGSAERLPVTG